MNWFRIAGAVSIVVLLFLLLYGSYEFYFNKSIPIENHYIVKSGGVLNQKQGTSNKYGHLFTGIIGNSSNIMGEIGWIW